MQPYEELIVVQNHLKMPPRTRRAAAANEGGGVLASLNRNVPAFKRGNKAVSKQQGEENINGDKLDDSLARTPPPFKSIVVERSKTDFSPLTQPRLPKQVKKHSYVETLLDNESSSQDSEADEDETASTKSFPPVNENKKTPKGRRHIAESSDEETVEMDEPQEPEETDESSLEDDSDPDDLSEDLQTESRNASESEVDEEDSEASESGVDEEDSEASEEEDDEYVPDEDEESVTSDEDLSDYVEEERKESKKRGPTQNKSISKLKNVPPKTPEVNAYTEGDSVDFVAPGDKLWQHNQGPLDHRLLNNAVEARSCFEEDSYGGAGAPTQTSEVLMPNIEALTLDGSNEENDAIMDDDDDDCDVLVATVVEADDDDFYDNDVLIATIVNDEGGKDDDSIHKSDDDCTVNEMSETEDAETNLSDDCTTTSDAEDSDERGIVGDYHASAPGTIIKDDLKTQQIHRKYNCDSVTDVPKEGEQIERSTVSEVNAASKCKNPEETSFDIDHNTPVSKGRQVRKSFFRVEGLIKKGKWKLGSKIGVGSFGTVHVGMNNETGKLMAVKVFKIDGAIMKDIRREVELMRSLEHPNIVRYLGAQMDRVHMHIFQEWVPGGSVATLLGRFGPFSLQVIQSYISQALSGLAYLHDNDIIHRDIKGSNILVNDEGIVKLADFGASKKLDNLRANLMMSMTIRGTPYFMSPEVFEEKYSAKADIWGIGCVAHQMMTGSPPWKEGGFSNPISLFNYIKKHNGPPVVDKDNTERLMKEDKNIFLFLDDFLQLCFDKDPSKRPNAENLLEHTFFTKMHHDVDDGAVLLSGLFSPTLSDGTTPRDTSPSPSLTPPAVSIPHTATRSKSVVKWRTTFSSPPRSTRRSNTTAFSPVSPSPFSSPAPDTSAWPDWAQAELEKRKLFAKTPAKSSQVESNESKLRATMDSLVHSADSIAVDDRASHRASHDRGSTVGTPADQSGLVGLNLLDNSNVTFEI